VLHFLEKILCYWYRGERQQQVHIKTAQTQALKYRQQLEYN